MSDKLRITVSDVRAKLDAGMSRKEINRSYGKTDAEMKALVWSHPTLKFAKARKVYDTIELVDDENQTGQASPANTAGPVSGATDTNAEKAEDRAEGDSGKSWSRTTASEEASTTEE